jgi:hypothetical protein
MYIRNSARIEGSWFTSLKLWGGAAPSSAFKKETGRAIVGRNNKSVYGISREECMK